MARSHGFGDCGEHHGRVAFCKTGMPSCIDIRLGVGGERCRLLHAAEGSFFCSLRLCLQPSSAALPAG
jgi:hypothetical protein